MAFEVGSRFLIVRSWESVSPGARIPIILGPGQAFGSGEHETTRTCLEEMELLDRLKGAAVLDLGCGTGILSIAAARLGARSVVALDPDPQAIAAAAANIRLNGLDKTVTCVQGEMEKMRGACFDLILANLYGDLLIGLARDIPGLIRPGGQALLSGVRFEDAFELRSDLVRYGLRLMKQRSLEEYITLLFGKNSA